MKNIIVILAVALSFFLGRESKVIIPNQKPPKTYIPNSFTPSSIEQENESYPAYLSNNIKEGLERVDTVYRCGQSRIYHPSLSHGSFKNCKSKVYKLTVERAKELGMRHCKCRS